MAGPTWHTKALYNGSCDNCDRTYYAQNAMGLAAQHYARTGHTVRVEASTTFVWENPESVAKWRAELEAQRGTSEVQAEPH